MQKTNLTKEEAPLSLYERYALGSYRTNGVGMNYPSLYKKLKAVPKNLRGYWEISKLIDGTLRPRQNWLLKTFSKKFNLPKLSARQSLTEAESLYDLALIYGAQLDWLAGKTTLYVPAPDGSRRNVLLKEIPESWAALKEPVSPEERAKHEAELAELQAKADEESRALGLPTTRDPEELEGMILDYPDLVYGIPRGLGFDQTKRF
jgi:hypothetical protein